MMGNKILLGFNTLLYAINGFLWQLVAHQSAMAFMSVAVAIGSAIAMRFTED